MKRPALLFLLTIPLCSQVFGQVPGQAPAPIPAPAPLRLTLDEAEALAIRQHPRLAGERFATQAAAQVTRETRSNLYPQLNGSLTAVGTINDSRIAAGFINAPNVFNRAAAGIAIQQLITDSGRTGHLIESSRLRQQSQAQTENATRETVLLEVNRAYYRSLRANALERVSQETVAARQVVTDQVTALAQSNLKSQLDVSFANVNLADAKLLLAEAQNEVREAFADLSNTLGFSDPQTFELSEPPAATPPDSDLSGLIRQAMTGRPDLAGLRFDRDAAAQFTQAEKALSRPTVSVAAVGGGVPAHEAALSGRYGAIGVNVNIPVFNGSLFTARRLEAELRAQAAAQRLRDAENRAARDVQVAWLGANNTFQKIALTAQLLAQANLALDLAQSRYELGLSSIVELTQAQLNKTNAEIQTLTARYEFQSDSAALQYELGALQ